MALVKYSAIISNIRGSIGSATFQVQLGGNVLRSKPRPSNRNTPEQSIIRQNIKTVQAAWSALTSEQRSSWFNFLSFVPSYQRRSPGVQLTGFTLFLRYNSIRLAAGFPLLTTLSYVELDVLQPVPVVIFSEGVLFLSYDEDFNVSDYSFLLKVTPAIRNVTMSNRKDLRILQVAHVGEKSSFPFTDAFVAKYGSLPAVGTGILVSVQYFKANAPILSQPFFVIKTF